VWGQKRRTQMTDKLTISWGRDYRTATKYEFCLFEGELLVHREGYFSSSSAAKRAGLKAAQNWVTDAEAMAA